MTLIIFILAKNIVKVHLDPNKSRYTFANALDQFNTASTPVQKSMMIPWAIVKIIMACISYVAHFGTYFDPINDKKSEKMTLSTLYDIVKNFKRKNSYQEHDFIQILQPLAQKAFKSIRGSVDYTNFYKTTIASYNENVGETLRLDPNVLNKVNLIKKEEFKDKTDALLKQMFFLFTPDAFEDNKRSWLHLVPIGTCLITTIVYGLIMQYKILPYVTSLTPLSSSSSSLAHSPSSQNEAIQRAFSRGILINAGVIGASYLGILRFFF
jgi:hypothetical protein